MRVANYTIENLETGLTRQMRLPILNHTALELSSLLGIGKEMTKEESEQAFGASLETVRQFLVHNADYTPWVASQGGEWAFTSKSDNPPLTISTASNKPINGFQGTTYNWGGSTGVYWSGTPTPNVAFKYPGGSLNAFAVVSGSGNYVIESFTSEVGFEHAQALNVFCLSSDGEPVTVDIRKVNGRDFSTGYLKNYDSYTGHSMVSYWKDAEYTESVFEIGVTEPDDELGGFFDIMERFAPVIWSNGTGLYAMNRYEVQDLFTSLYETTVIESIRETVGLFGDSGSSIKSLRWFYGLKDAFKRETDKRIVQVGTKTLDESTGKAVKGNVLLSEYGRHMSDIFTVTPHFGSYLDHSPYTRYMLHVPYHGYVELEGQDVVGKYIQLTYHVDAHAGSGLVFINEVTAAGVFVKTINTIPVAVAVDIPLSVSSSPSPLEFVGNVARLAAGAVAMAGGAMGMGAIMMSNRTGMSGDLSKETNMEEGVNKVKGLAQEAETVTAPTLSGMTSTNVSGGSSGISYLDNLDIFMIIVRPIVANPDALGIMGEPVDKVHRIGDLSGFVKTGNFTEFSSNRYKGKIENMLKEGVYI